MSDKKNKMIGKVGGQALIEGVMMRGPDIEAMAVRLPDGSIDVEQWNLKKPTIWSKIPFVRGIVNFVITLMDGYKCLGKSAEKAGLEDETDEPETKFELFLQKHVGDKLTGIIMVIGMILALALSVVLFIMLPAFFVKWIDMLIPLGGFKSLIEGIMKIIIFIGYLALVSKNKDIRRVFEYHGAEHKSIFCFEAGEELTIENVRKQSRFHPRCGTSFMLIIIIISILVFSLPFITWDNILLRSVIKIAFLPLILGIAYELIKLAGRHNNIITKIISFPGLKLQHLTTKEPDDSQIEVAIASLLPCIGVKGQSDITNVTSEITEQVAAND